MRACRALEGKQFLILVNAYQPSNFLYCRRKEKGKGVYNLKKRPLADPVYCRVEPDLERPVQARSRGRVVVGSNGEEAAGVVAVVGVSMSGYPRALAVQDPALKSPC